MMQRYKLYAAIVFVCLTVFAFVGSCGGDSSSDSNDHAFDDDTDDDDDVPSDDDTGDDDSSDDDTGDDDTNDDDTIDDDTIDDDTSDDDTTDDDTGDDDTAPPECDDYGLPHIVGNLGTTDLTETSGIAISRKNPGVMWAHNDSGDGPYVFAMTLEGDYLGTALLDGATAVDWEDMTIGPCGEDQCLYLGDHGDNGASRTDCAVYRVVEPEVDPLDPFEEMTLSDWDYLPFTYPGGPRDAEALAVHPDGDVYVFSKYPYGVSEVYVFPALTPDVPVELTYLGDLDTGGGLAMTTAADIHPNGRFLLLRTYLTITEWRLDEGTPFAEIIVAPQSLVPAGVEIQGEALAYDPATGGYLHVQEGTSMPIFRVDCSE